MTVAVFVFSLLGAMAIGVPGWPEFACCTASIDSVLMVFTAS